MIWSVVWYIIRAWAPRLYDCQMLTTEDRENDNVITKILELVHASKTMSFGRTSTIKVISVYKFSHLFQCKAGRQRITIWFSCFSINLKLRIPLIIYSLRRLISFSEFEHRKSEKRLELNIEIILYIWFIHSSWCQLSLFIFDKWSLLEPAIRFTYRPFA